jgi:hypothetical protein
MSGGDSYREVSSQNWFSRIGSAIKGVLIGIVLFFVSFVVLFWNEGRAVHRARDLEEGAKNVVSVSADKVDESNNGKLVHMTGMAEPEGMLTDLEFGISAKAIHLRRLVEMYQYKEEAHTKKEKKLGGGEDTITTYTYDPTWSDHAEVLQYDGRDKVKYSNPPMPTIENRTWDAEVVKLGAFHLSKEMIGKIENFEDLPVKDSSVEGSAKKPASFEVRNGTYYKPADPAASKAATAPAIGDVRVSFKEVKPETISLMARQTKDTFDSYPTKGGGSLLELRLGDMSADAMIKTAQEENTALTWILRLVGFLLMAIGIYLVFNPLVVLMDVIPFLGNVLGVGVSVFSGLIAVCLSLVTIAIGWIFYRPLLGVALLAGALVVFLLLWKLMQMGRARLRG